MQYIESTVRDLEKESKLLEEKITQLRIGNRQLREEAKRLILNRNSFNLWQRFNLQLARLI